MGTRAVAGPEVQGKGIRERLAPWLAPVIGMLLFVPTLWYGFVWDDQLAIVGNESLKSFSAFAQVLWGKIDPAIGMYRPVTNLVLLIEVRLFGFQPWGFHLVSILLHGLACAVMYRLVFRLTRRIGLSVFASVLFAVMAVHLEAVAWVSAFAEPLAATCIFAGFICYLHYREQRQGKWLAGVCAWFFVGLLTKETALVLPLLMLMFELTVGDSESRGIRRNIVPAGAMCGVLVVYLALRQSVYTTLVYSESKLPFSTMFFTWPSLLVTYCKHLLIPTPLSPFYDSDYVFSAGSAFWLPVGILLAMAVVVYVATRRMANGGLIRFCVLAMGVAIIPVLNLNVFQFREILHDRFLYVPSVFFAILLGVVFFGGDGSKEGTNKNSPSTLYFALAGCLVLLNVAALLIQSPVWRNDMALYSYAVRVAPGNPRPAATLAFEFLKQGDLVHAEQLLSRVVRILPSPKAYFVLGETRLRMGHPEEAEDPLRKAITAAPQRPGQHFMLGECLQSLGRLQEAKTEYNSEMALSPVYREAALQKISQMQ